MVQGGFPFGAAGGRASAPRSRFNSAQLAPCTRVHVVRVDCGLGLITSDNTPQRTVVVSEWCSAKRSNSTLYIWYRFSRTRDPTLTSTCKCWRLSTRSVGKRCATHIFDRSTSDARFMDRLVGRMHSFISRLNSEAVRAAPRAAHSIRTRARPAWNWMRRHWHGWREPGTAGAAQARLVDTSED